MKVRILTSIASAAWSYAPGDIVDMPDEQALAWIKGGNAAPVEAPKREDAMVEPPEVRGRKRVK